MAGQHALVRAGYHVITAADGEEGLRLAREKMPDLLVLDMMPPKLSGEQVLHELRNDPRTAKMAVMVLTSLPQCNEAKLKSDGATSYYQKSKLDWTKTPPVSSPPWSSCCSGSRRPKPRPRADESGFLKRPPVLD